MFSIEEKPKKNNTIIFIILGITVVIVLVCLYYLYITRHDNMKINKNKDLIYTRYQRKNDNLITKVPMININSSDAKRINKEIADTMNKFLVNKSNISDYEYSINNKKKILSVVLIMIDNNAEYTPEFKFKSYNISLDTLRTIPNKEILSLYNTNTKVVSYRIKERFKEFYKDELEQGYLDKKECNYDCFLEWRNITNYLDNIQYYINNNKLYVYKEFTPYSVYSEEEYYTLDHFVTYIKD